MARFFSLEGETTTKFHKSLSNAYGKSVPWYATVTSQLRKLKRRKEDVKDEYHSCRQITQKESVQKVHQIMLENRNWEYS